MCLITGGSGSGKSEYAEKTAVWKHRCDCPGGLLYYIATMKPYDEECYARIRRHRRMRGEKQFITKECYTHLERIEAGGQDVVLIECMSNLLANEMYLEQGRIKERGEGAYVRLEEAVLSPLRKLEAKAGCVVVVTNEVFSDGMTYDEETGCYVKLLGMINQALADMADSVVEVVCAIPVAGKGELPC